MGFGQDNLQCRRNPNVGGHSNSCEPTNVEGDHNIVITEVPRELPVDSIVIDPPVIRFHGGEEPNASQFYVQRDHEVGQVTLDRVFESSEEARALELEYIVEFEDFLVRTNRGQYIRPNHGYFIEGSEFYDQFLETQQEISSLAEDLVAYVPELRGHPAPVMLLTVGYAEELESVILDYDDNTISAGFYTTGTNLISIKMNALISGDRRALILHELFHYASYANGGFYLTLDRNNGSEIDVQSAMWFHEGLTESLSRQRLMQRGYAPDQTIRYHAGVAISFFLQNLLLSNNLSGQITRMPGNFGEATRMLEQAYFTGDFTEVRTRIDALLGVGTFERLLNMESAEMGLEFLLERMSRANMNYAEWVHDDPIMMPYVVNAIPSFSEGFPLIRGLLESVLLE